MKNFIYSIALLLSISSCSKKENNNITIISSTAKQTRSAVTLIAVNYVTNKLVRFDPDLGSILSLTPITSIPLGWEFLGGISRYKYAGASTYSYFVSMQKTGTFNQAIIEININSGALIGSLINLPNITSSFCAVNFQRANMSNTSKGDIFIGYSASIHRLPAPYLTKNTTVLPFLCGGISFGINNSGIARMAIGKPTNILTTTSNIYNWNNITTSPSVYTLQSTNINSIVSFLFYNYEWHCTTIDDNGIEYAFYSGNNNLSNNMYFAKNPFASASFPIFAFYNSVILSSSNAQYSMRDVEVAY
jgi:hypothetical protein